MDVSIILKWKISFFVQALGKNLGTFFKLYYYTIYMMPAFLSLVKKIPRSAVKKR